MKSNRPVYLSISQFSWPFAALASITHRIAGAVLFFALLGLLYALNLALSSPAGFAEAQELHAAVRVKPLFRSEGGHAFALEPEKYLRCGEAFAAVFSCSGRLGPGPATD